MFMIVNLDTGERLPVAKCASRAEFSATKPPRLFARKSDAINALACWNEGIWFHSVDSYGESEGPMPSTGKFNVERSAKRKAMNTAVVAVRLEVLP